MASKYYHRFGYRFEERTGRKVDIHKQRDGEAFIQLAPLFHKEGYAFGRSIINTPIDPPKAPIPYDDSFMRPTDLLVLCTRPPMHDEESEALKGIGRSYTTLEDKVFAAMGKCFSVCARDHIEITPHLAEQLPVHYKNRAHMILRQKGGAQYRQLRESASHRWQEVSQEGRTALFLVHDREPWPGGPRLLAVFGVGGNETLVWAYLLSKKYWKKLDLVSSCFVMMEMTTIKIPSRPGDLTFADNLEVEMLLHASIGGVVEAIKS